MNPWLLGAIIWALIVIWVAVALKRHALKPKYRGCKYEMGFGHCWWSIAWDVPWDCPRCEKFKKKEVTKQ